MQVPLELDEVKSDVSQDPNDESRLELIWEVTRINRITGEIKLLK